MLSTSVLGRWTGKKSRVLWSRFERNEGGRCCALTKENTYFLLESWFVPFSWLTCDNRKNQRQTEPEREGKRCWKPQHGTGQQWFSAHGHGTKRLGLRSPLTPTAWPSPQSFGVHTVLPLTITEPALPKSMIKHHCIKLSFPYTTSCDHQPTESSHCLQSGWGAQSFLRPRHMRPGINIIDATFVKSNPQLKIFCKLHILVTDPSFCWFSFTIICFP